MLLLHSLGIREAATFDWLDKPDPQAVLRAERLLTMLGALADADLTPIGRQMLRLPMHPRYSRMLIEASQRGCVPDAALCAALVSGRDLLARLDRDDAQTKAAREMFEDSADSDFITLMRAYEFAKENGFSLERCRSYGINAQVARQVEQTFLQIMHAARQSLPSHDLRPASTDALLRCLMAGFADQLAKRRTPGKPECDLTDQRAGMLVRASVVTEAPFFVSANLRETPSRQTLLSLATAVQPAWIAEMFPQHLTTTIEHLFDAQNKRVAVMRLVRYHDLVIEQKTQQRDLDPAASGRCLAEAYGNGAFDLPLFDHRLRQFIARVNLVHATLPELEFAPFDDAAITRCLARAFAGLTLAKEAQAAPLLHAFHQHLEKGMVSWLDELTHLSLPWPAGGTIKINYLADTPEAQVKLQDCFALKEHPALCEGRAPILLSLHTPDGKRLATTTDWPSFLTREWPKHRQAVAKKFPGVMWR